MAGSAASEERSPAGSRQSNAEEDGVDGEWEYRPLRLPPEVSRLTASVRLGIQAEYGGWELSRVRLYPGGERKVWLRRRRTHHTQPGLSY
ncbi:MAG: DUF5703 family protein [Pseudonocardia sp.]